MPLRYLLRPRLLTFGAPPYLPLVPAACLLAQAFFIAALSFGSFGSESGREVSVSSSVPVVLGLECDAGFAVSSLLWSSISSFPL